MLYSETTGTSRKLFLRRPLQLPVCCPIELSALTAAFVRRRVPRLRPAGRLPLALVPVLIPLRLLRATALLLLVLTLLPRSPSLFLRILGSLRCRLPSPPCLNVRLPTLVVPRLLRLLVHRRRSQAPASPPVARLLIARTLPFRTLTRLRPPRVLFRILGAIWCRCRLPSLLSLNIRLPTLIVPLLLPLLVRRPRLRAPASPPFGRLAIAPTVSSRWSPTTRRT